MQNTTLRRVDELQAGDTVVGTNASGAFETGPRMLKSISEEQEHSVRTTAWLCQWFGGGHNVYYGDTLVMVKR